MQRNGKASGTRNGAVLSEALPPRTSPATLLDTDAPATVTLLDTDTTTSPAAPGAEPVAHKLSASAPATIKGQLLATRVALDTVQGNAAMQAALAQYGYDAARMAEGRALYEQALSLLQQQRAGRGERYAAVDARGAAQEQAHAVYIRQVAVARVALRKDRGAAEKLGLTMTRKQDQAGWLDQAQQFYTNALGISAIAQKLASFGLTAAQLSAGQSLVAAVAAKLVAQQEARADARALTEQRDEALAALRDWMRDFRAIARVALG